VKRGIVLPMVLIVGSILLVFGVTLHRFVGQQNANVHMIAAGEVAHFLAEAGISSCVRAVRESLGVAGLLDGANTEIHDLLTRPQPLPDTSLMSHLKDTWNTELEKFAKEVDKSARIRVEVWLRGFTQTETDVKRWVDPGAKVGWLSIEATGEFRGVRRVLSVKRKVWVGNVLPPVVCKFTLHLRDVSRGNAGGGNIIRNDYAGTMTDGPKPFVCLNHTTPSDFFPFAGKAVSAIQTEEKDPNVYQKRGWIWLGGGPVRLNLTSGSGEFGEIFHFYDVSTSNAFQPIKFRTAMDKLPPNFSQAMTLPWDLLLDDDPGSLRHFTYSFGHSFVLEGFHDKSNRKEHDAMYERNILSRTQELPRFGSKSSMFRLFGLARQGFQSRTKVFGQVTAAFPRFATLEVKSDDSEVQQRFSALSPPPMYLLPSVGPGEYRDVQPISDFLSRRVGGPILGLGVLFANQTEYAKFMSCVVEAPYNLSYSAMQDAVDDISPRQFPPSRTLLEEDLGEELVVAQEHLELYRGPIAAPDAVAVALSRVQRRMSGIDEFWKTFFDETKKELVLNEIIQIENPDGQTLLLPPPNLPYPLKVAGGGMIILDQGNLTLRGVQMQSPEEALTIVLRQGTSVQFETPQLNQVNILAPRANLSYSVPAEVLGTVALNSILPDARTAGGYFRFREDQDPTRPGYFRFYKARIHDQDTFWHE
jgi:hypothetical protein